jgi:integrase/recombinase XerD
MATSGQGLSTQAASSDLAVPHLAEQNVSLPLLMAKSRHASLRSLQRYARPGAEAVAARTAATDPARRRR